MSRILDYRETERVKRVEVGRLPGQVNGHDRFRPRSDEGGDVLGVDVQVAFTDVREDGCRSRVDNHVRRRRPGDRRRDHLVARPDADRERGKVESGRPGRDGERVLRSCVLGEALLELGRARPRRQPARAQGLGDGRDLLLPDRRRLEAEKGATWAG